MGAPGRALKKLAPLIYLAGRRDCDDAGAHALATGQPVHVMVDVGCGDGEMTQRWWRAARAERCIGLDFLEVDMAVARERGIETRKTDLSEPWPVADGECELVVSSQNLEHMHRTMFYASEMYRILQPGGRAVVLTENLASWANIGALLFGWQPFSSTLVDGVSLGSPWIWHADIPKEESHLGDAKANGVVGVLGHVRVLAYRGLKEVMEKSGFEVTRYVGAGYAPLWGWPSRLMCRVDPRHGHFLVLEARKPLQQRRAESKPEGQRRRLW